MEKKALQVQELLKKLKTTAEEWAVAKAAMAGSSIGRHMQHTPEMLPQYQHTTSAAAPVTQNAATPSPSLRSPIPNP